ncbi:LytR/AlgR family response regulator transcription factor [Dyella acidisoli]|uniref:DNA-binding response regulator n=1 Tax=Dyella acidisoli TaxID=1867834 RepID=A0ABQ5XJT4_9GAMM|nr:LytTR family DNA-binding domain-containing protein [Dyella acidisoli]GLQ91955.1 DNA-binding response regulator [Dyella acidisoli]
MGTVAPSERLRVLVVDDEPLARSNLVALLRPRPDVELIGECDSGMQALTMIRSDRPDVVFLDVQMPECDGFDVLELLGAELPPAIVFVTAYDGHALRAFEVGALDYLLKPFDDARFERALDRARERWRQRADQPPRSDRLVVRSVGQVLFVDTATIDWIEADDYYACLHIGSRTHLLRRSLNDLERDLNPAVFCRIHRSTIVRLAQVEALETDAEGEYEVVLRTGVKLRVSRRYRRGLLERLCL